MVILRRAYGFLELSGGEYNAIRFMADGSVAEIKRFAVCCDDAKVNRPTARVITEEFSGLKNIPVLTPRRNARRFLVF